MRSALVLLIASASLAFAADWKVEYSVPKDAKANFDTPLTITVKDAKGAPVVGADVEAVLTMVEMDHGEFKSPAKQVKPGVYQAKTNFIMVGLWQIEVRAKKGGESVSKKFRHDVKE